MSIARLEFVLRVLGGVLAALAALEVGRGHVVPSFPFLSSSSYLAELIPYLLALAGLVLGFALTPYLTTRPFFWLLQKVVHTPIADILAAAGGLFVGLVIGLLLIWPLSLLPFFGGFLPIVAMAVLGYLGMTTMLTHKREVFQALSLPRELFRLRGGGVSEHARILVDTSAIIDGRIADLGQTGFLPGPLVVPRFVLDELQHIADSPDALRRNRGRRGLDVLERLQKQQRVPLEVIGAELDSGQTVDSQLVRLAKTMKCSIITNDLNLNRVAAIQGVNVLNINELANAMKSVVLPGEEMLLRVIQEGKDFGQGVGYLDDGTMVVVENGRQYLASEVEIVVKRVHQTAAGRMVFAQPKSTSRTQAVK
jgi:uncharacterized protein YacL